MTDLPPSDAPPAEGALPSADPPAGGDAPPPEPSPSGAPPAGGEDTFDRAYVEQLRQEAAEHRVRAKEAREAAEQYGFFNEVPDDARELLLGLNRTIVEDPTGAGAREMVRFLRQLTGDDFDSIIDEAKNPQFLTREEARAEAEKVAEERERARIAKEAEQSLWSKVSDLGFERNTPDAGLLLWYANVEHDGDLDKASESVQAFRQAVIDSYVAEQRETNGKFPPVSGAVTGAPKDASDAPPESVSAAGDRFRAWLAGQKD